MLQDEDEAKVVLLPSKYSEDDEQIEDTPVVTALTGGVLNKKKDDDEDDFDNDTAVNKALKGAILPPKSKDDINYLSDSDDEKKPKDANNKKNSEGI